MQVMIKMVDGMIEDVLSGSDDKMLDYMKEYTKDSGVELDGLDLWESVNRWNQYSWDTGICSYFSIHDTEDLQ